ncbi:hypothetical protein ACLB1Q_14540 [Escherichia coli]
MRHDRGYFNVSNGGKIHVKGTSRLTYLQGNVSGEGSQVNSKTFFMGVYGSYGGNQYLSLITAVVKLMPVRKVAGLL